MHIKNLIFRAVAAGVAVFAVCQTGQASKVFESSAVIAAAAPQQTVDFEVFLPLRNRAGLEQLIGDQQNEASPSYHQWLTPHQFAAQFGPTAASMQRVQAALKAGGLQIAAVHSRSLTVRGSVAQVQHMFSTQLNLVKRPGALARLVAAGRMSMPAVLTAEGAVVARFAGLPLRHTMSKNLGLTYPSNRNGPYGGYNYNDLKQAYGYPSYQTKVRGENSDGTGANVAVVIDNDVLDSDIKAMFDHEHFSQTTGKPAPVLAGRMLINGGAPFDPDTGDSFEGSLDVQQVLGGAPGASVTLVNLPDLSDDNIMAGYLAIIESNAFDVVNSSFGGCEKFYAPEYNDGEDFTYILDIYDSLFAQGNAQGITFVASSGDSGGLQCPDPTYFSGDPNATPKFVPGISSPADDSHVTAVGGTNLATTKPPSPQTTPLTLTSQYVSENADGDPEIPYDPYGVGLNVTGGYWGAGGGISSIYTAPGYQLLDLTLTLKRTNPDVGMQVGGCPGGIAVLPCSPDRSFVVTTVDGLRYGLIGTSVASPEFVGALALAIQKTKSRLGNVNYFLYRRAVLQDLLGGVFAPGPFQFYHRKISGFDGYYSTNSLKNYNYITGNGTPDVRLLFDLGSAAAGNPQTASNP